jgi:DNA-directed RNA polymerase specialized sigma24 family protein
MSALSPLYAPAAAFDQLHARHAAALTHQTFLLCGRRRAAERAVARAFRLAWERWPEVARDADPVGWVRARAHEYALAPWRLPRGSYAGGATTHAALLEALLRLPPCHRRAVVLHDAVGLDLAATAAEVEATTPAAAGRIVRAREAMAGWVPRLAETSPAERGPVLRELLSGLPRPQRVRTSGAALRRESERATRRLNEAAAALVMVMAALIALAALVG